MNLTLVVIGATRECLSQFSVEEFPTRLVMLANTEGIPVSVLANRELDQCPSEVFGVVHADTRFGKGALAAFYDLATQGNVTGIVGVTPKKKYIWCHSNPGPVMTLDCCSVFFRKDSGLRFDEQFGMHCYVEDLCMEAHKREIPVLVPATQAGHIGQSTNDPQWQAEYRKTRKLLTTKWPDVETT